jgi:hypothetical protein
VSISKSLRQIIRKRANFRCEYCGVSETESGGELTLDHFQPISVNGDSSEENLIYCCFRCNLYKGDYWTTEPSQTPIFNPKKDKFDDHFWLAETGKLFGLTETGEFAVKLLRLNRPSLITKRRQDFQNLEEQQILEQTNKALETLIQLSQQQRELLQKQQEFLREQQRLIEFLIK